ncbi:two-component sensor histidine kinase [Lachnospiraceae bacterium KM106-2]|nr:two-component sensor histidine kinase [Lachnospiraceae bacterium KM106-2]
MALMINFFIKLFLITLLNSIPFIVLVLTPFHDMLRFSKKTTIIFTCIAFLLHSLNGIYYIHTHDSAMVNAISILIFCLLSLICINASIYQLLFVYFIVINYAFELVIGTKYLERFLFPNYYSGIYNKSYILILLVLLCLTYPIFYSYLKRRVRTIVHVSGNGSWWHYLFSIPLMFCLFYFYFFFHIHERYSYADNFVSFLYLIVLIVGTYLFYWIAFNLIQESIQNNELSQQIYAYDLQVKQYNILDERMKETRKMRHDLRHHFLVMQSYLENKELDQLHDYIKEYTGSLPSNEPLLYCENLIANNIISYYLHNAQQEQINVDYHLFIPKDLFIKDIDLAVLLGNLLENALEACMAIPDHKNAVIQLKALANSPETFIIVLENCHNNLIQKTNNNHFLSSKKDRVGIGTQSIKTIADKYNGEVHYEYDAHKFFTFVILHR